MAHETDDSGEKPPTTPPIPNAWSTPLISSPRSTELMRIPDNELLKDLIIFLKSFTLRGNRTPAYSAQLRNLGAPGYMALSVEFGHLLEGMQMNKKLRHLVVRIGNDPGDDWLAPAAKELMMESQTIQEFLRGGGIVPENAKNSVRVIILNKPTSVMDLKSFLTDKSQPPTCMIPVLAGRRLVYAATSRGRFGFRVALVKILANFRLDLWFGDELCIDDFFILNSEHCYISKSTTSLNQLRHLSPTEASKIMAKGKKENLRSLWEMMNPFFRSVDGKLPIYFKLLMEDLTCATLEQVKEEWFNRYMLFHFAFTSSMCRKFFICECYQVCKTHSLSTNDTLTSAADQSDWRMNLRETNDYILNRVFWHGIKMDQLEQRTATLIENGSFGDIDDLHYERTRTDTVGGLLDYKRHLLQHCDQHFRKEMEMKKMGKDANLQQNQESVIKDIDEIEFFASSSVPEVEVLVLKSIMKGTITGFDSVISLYEASFRDKRDPPRRR